MSKIGLLITAFECEDELDEVLKPWIKYRNLGKDELIISVNSVQFKEWAELYPNNNQNTINKLYTLKHIDKVIDFVSTSEIPLTEWDARNLALKPLLDEKCDYVILLDSDEHYSLKDIENICNYIQKDPFIALYKIKMRNLVFDNSRYTLDFCPSRVWKTNLTNYTLSHFTFDNDCAYRGILTRDIKFDKDFPCKAIPNVLPNHHSWNDLERSKKKIAYQKVHFSHGAGCSFKISDDGARLEWDESYFKKTGQIKPEVFGL